MRIIAGRHRGRPIEAPPGREVRPTADRTRQALFNILEHGRFATNGSPYAGKTVLDAFAGTGAFGLEALSRGAAHAMFLDLAPAAQRAIRANIALLDEEDRATVARADATKPSRAPQRCALAFLDPPYGKEMGPVALTALRATGWFEPGAIVVLEVAAKEPFTAPEGFTVEDERVYGAARLIFLRVQQVF